MRLVVFLKKFAPFDWAADVVAACGLKFFDFIVDLVPFLSEPI